MIDSVFALADARDAFARVGEAGKIGKVGKVVLGVSDAAP